MKKALLLLSFLAVSSTISVACTAVTCGSGNSLTVMDGACNIIVAGQALQPNVALTITACFPSTPAAVSKVVFSDTATTPSTAIGSVTTPAGAGTKYPYTVSWSPLSGAHTLSAMAIYPGSGANPSSLGTSNPEIDMVGDPSLTTLQYTMNDKNPANDTLFGEGYNQGYTSNAWAPGDNQVCTADTSAWPYNNSNSSWPDGTCQATGDTSSPATSTYQPPASFTPTGVSTMDGLDDTMHTLSDFLKYSQTILNKDPGTLSSTFDTWYPQVAAWTMPACNNVGGAQASGIDPSTGGSCTLPPTPAAGAVECTPNTTSCDPNCRITCNPGNQSGRLLSIYDPVGYPNVPGTTSNTSKVDVLGDWNTKVFTPWLKNNYANAKAWCVPLEASISNTTEDKYIDANSSTSCADGSICRNNKCQGGTGVACINWGDLPHVISCLNYNSGQNPAMPSSTLKTYSDCLTQLNSMADTNADCHPTTTVVTGGTVTWPPNCDPALLGTPPNPAVAATPPSPNQYGTKADCDVFTVGSFANWVSNASNFGPAYNYQQCLNYLTTMNAASTCPASISGTVCDSTILGRDLLLYSGKHTAPTFDNCTATGNYMAWLNESLSLFSSETPKFALRSQFLTDAYNRAQSMQTILSEGDTALGKFLTPCSGTKCADGGPAAQLAYAQGQTAQTELIPNSVIYGWRDKTLATGHTLPASQGGLGYAHIVKVTAYSPGRNGHLAFGSPADIASFVQSKLPWIQTSSDWDSRTYKLVQRDGFVYVSIKRWDEPHGSSTFFPNGHLLWQFSYNGPRGKANQTPDLSACFGSTNAYSSKGFNGLGFGLESQTSSGLKNYPMSTVDSSLMSNAFMLNDEGDGNIDVNNKGTPATSCSMGTNSANSNYCDCLSLANSLLNQGVESHACAEYIASYSAAGPSPDDGDKSRDYSLKFVDCKKLGKMPEDMTYISNP